MTKTQIFKHWDKGEHDFFRGAYNARYSLHPLEQNFYAQGYLHALQRAARWVSDLRDTEAKIALLSN